jgi:lysophospholipase L1-like esterase
VTKSCLQRLAALLFLFLTATAFGEHEGKVQILLLGDSTTIGSVCRRVEPKALHLEDVVRELLATDKELPPTNVINQGRDGEFIDGLLKSGRYEKEVATLPGIDYVVIRYGLNDLGRRENFDENFPGDVQALVERLRKDFPKAEIVTSTTIPYMSNEKDQQILTAIKKGAELSKTPLFDLYTPYAKELEKGHDMLNYRRYGLAQIPAEQHSWLKPWIVDNTVVCMDNQLDVHFGHLPGWYGDRHPNLAGYHVIGKATADYLAERLKERTGK